MLVISRYQCKRAILRDFEQPRIVELLRVRIHDSLLDSGKTGHCSPFSQSDTIHLPLLNHKVMIRWYASGRREDVGGTARQNGLPVRISVESSIYGRDRARRDRRV